MLGRMLHQRALESDSQLNDVTNGHAMPNGAQDHADWRTETEFVDWIDQNTINLVSEGENTYPILVGNCSESDGSL